MTSSIHLESYREALVFLATAGVVVPLFHRIKVSPVLGFLFAGAALGPFGLGRLAGDHEWARNFTITNVEGVSNLAEFGLVFLLFMIGLELSWERLARLRRLVFGLGLAQVVVCASVLAAVGYYHFDVEFGALDVDGHRARHVVDGRGHAGARRGAAAQQDVRARRLLGVAVSGPVPLRRRFSSFPRSPKPRTAASRANRRRGRLGAPSSPWAR